MNKEKKQELFNQAMAFHQQGKFDEADKIYLSVIEKDTKNFAANYLHGCILSDKNNFSEAINFFTIALESNPNNFEVNNSLGIAYKNLGKTKDAEKYFLRAINIDESNYRSYFNCANLYADQGNYELAIEFFKKTIDKKNDFPEAYHRLGETYQDVHTSDRKDSYILKSIECFENALLNANSYTMAEFFPSNTFLFKGLSHLWIGEIDEANYCFNMYHTNDEVEDYILKNLSTKKNLVTLISHEYEQLTYLISKYPQSTEIKYDQKYYNDLSNMYMAIENNTFSEEMVNSNIKNKLKKNIYNKNPENNIIDIVNKDNAISQYENEYLNKQPEVVIVDDFLTNSGLSNLRQFCLESNIFKYSHGGSYVGAYLTKGLSNIFFLRLSEELKSVYSRIFKNLRLTQAWIYKYDKRKEGVDIHADPAKVNVNFWITPESANLDKKTGGLKIWNKIPPEDWSFDDYNASAEKHRSKRRGFLAENKATEQIVSYKENRAIIFNSKLFHATDNINFSDKYIDRRINVTLLYE